MLSLTAGVAGKEMDCDASFYSLAKLEDFLKKISSSI